MPRCRSSRSACRPARRSSRRCSRSRSLRRGRTSRRIPTQFLSTGANEHNVSNVRWSRARWVRECAEMARARAAEALTRGGWASSSAQRWDTCRHRHEETNVSRARPHTPGARWDRARDPARDARGSVCTEEGAARIDGVGRKEAQAAAAQRGQRTSLWQPLLVTTVAGCEKAPIWNGS